MRKRSQVSTPIDPPDEGGAPGPLIEEDVPLEIRNNASGSSMSDAFEMIHETILKTDVQKSMDKVMFALKFAGENRTDYGHQLKALSLLEEAARECLNLRWCSKHEERHTELTKKSVEVAMREAAREALQEERGGAKVISAADVEGKAAEMFPDEWYDNEIKKTDIKSTVAVFETLIDQVRDVLRNVNTCLNVMRK